jgi:hypothetical protein
MNTKDFDWESEFRYELVAYANSKVPGDCWTPDDLIEFVHLRIRAERQQLLKAVEELLDGLPTRLVYPNSGVGVITIDKKHLDRAFKELLNEKGDM